MRSWADRGVPAWAAAAVAAATIAATVPVAPAWARSWIAWLLFLVLHVSLCRDAWAVSRDERSSRATRGLWRVFFVAGALFGVGDLAVLAALATGPWSYEVAIGTDLQQVLTLAGGALVLAAAALAPLRLGSRRESVRFVLDISVVILAVVAAAVVLDPGSTAGDGLSALPLTGPLIFAVATLALAKLVLAPDRPFSTTTGQLLGAAALGEALLGTLTVREDLATNLVLINGLALSSNALLALGARVQRSAAERPGQVVARRMRLVRLPYLAVVTTNLLLVATLATGGLTTSAWVVLGAATCSTALVLARQLLLLTEQQTLLGDLHHALAERDSLTHRLEHLAYHDALTGLGNRAMFEAAVDAALGQRSGSRRDGFVSIVLVDLDGFKEVNDAHGHSAGDEVLVTVADRLSTCVRGDDTVARFGGDEFALVLAQDAEQAEAVAWRIVELLARPFDVGGSTVQVGASVGVATTAVGETGGGDLLRRADVAMYRAKANGKNHVVVHAGATA